MAELAEVQKAAGTKQRLLESACAVFAEKGFQDATIAEICDAAEANIASVNYYFGSKENLYMEVLDFSFRVANERYPVDGGLPANAPPEARLKSFVTAIISRTFDNGIPAQFQRMLSQEVSHPGPATDYLFNNVLRRHVECLQKIVADLLTDDVPEGRRVISGLSVISLCSFFGFNQAARGRITDAPGFGPDRIQWLIDHTTHFALAGIRAGQNALSGDPDFKMTQPGEDK